MSSPENAVITGVSSNHDEDDDKGNDDVEGFDADDARIAVFPRGLEKFFKNIKLINIVDGRLK